MIVLIKLLIEVRGSMNIIIMIIDVKNSFDQFTLCSEVIMKLKPQIVRRQKKNK